MTRRKTTTRKRRTTTRRRRKIARSPLRRLIGWAAAALIVGASVLGSQQIPPALLYALPLDVRQYVEELQALVEPLVPEALRDQPPIYEPVPPGALPRTASSWNLARRTLYERVHFDQQRSLYCGCAYNADNRVSLTSCGLHGLIGNSRAERVEAEHVFPASQFGYFRQCWREPEAFPECTTSGGNLLSGRDCCQRVDPTFVAAHNDLHNLFPAVGYINGQRSNYNWGMLSRGETYGRCEIVIAPRIRRAQPPAAVRGTIARTMLYMRDTYDFRLSRQNEQLYSAWNNEFPPDAWEIERNRRIRAIQGLGNHYIENYRRL